MIKKESGIIEKQESQAVAWQIGDYLRGIMDLKESIVYQIGLSTLAFMLKNTSDAKITSLQLERDIHDETTLRFLQKLIKNHFEQVEVLANKFESGELAASVLYAEPRLFRQGDQFSTPDGVSRLALSLLRITEGDVVLDLGSGVGSFLIEAYHQSDNIELHGVEINTDSVIIANLRSFISGIPLEIVQGNMLSQDYSELQANKVFSNFPVGMRLRQLQKYVERNDELKKYFKDTRGTISGDWVYALSAYLSLKKPGRAVLLMANAGTWNKPDELLRKRLLENGDIEGVIQLPRGLFSHTGIPFTMLVLSPNNKMVKMVDASEFFTEQRRQNVLSEEDIEKIVYAYHNETERSREVGFGEIAEQEYIINPGRYLLPKLDLASGIGTVTLGDISLSINRGAMIRSSELDELVTEAKTGYHYLMLQNIRDGLIDSELPNLVDVSERDKRYCIKNGNLIISKISPFKIAVAKIEEDQTVLANGNLYFLELDESKVNPTFVSVFLQSELGLSQLNMLAKGAAMQNISIQDLKMVEIPNLPLEQQNAIAEEYEELGDELIVLQRHADLVRDRRAKLIEGVI